MTKPSPEDGSRFSSWNVVWKTLSTMDSIQQIYATNQLALFWKLNFEVCISLNVLWWLWTEPAVWCGRSLDDLLGSDDKLHGRSCWVVSAAWAGCGDVSPDEWSGARGQRVAESRGLCYVLSPAAHPPHIVPRAAHTSHTAHRGSRCSVRCVQPARLPGDVQ